MALGGRVELLFSFLHHASVTPMGGGGMGWPGGGGGGGGTVISASARHHCGVV